MQNAGQHLKGYWIPQKDPNVEDAEEPVAVCERTFLDRRWSSVAVAAGTAAVFRVRFFSFILGRQQR